MRFHLADPNTTNARRLSVAAADAVGRNVGIVGREYVADYGAGAAKNLSDMFGIQRPADRLGIVTQDGAAVMPSSPRAAQIAKMEAAKKISTTQSPGAPGRATLFETLSEAAKRRRQEEEANQ